MSDLLHHLKQVTGDLDELNASYALVGGMALSLRTEPRFTRDLDIAVAVESDAQAEQVVRHLTQRGYAILMQVEHESANRLATIRLALPQTTGIVVDLLFASCGIEDEIVAQAERIDALPGWTAPVARAEHLLAMKMLASDPANRPQDMVDARSLLQTMSAEEVEHARNAIRMIEQRGFNRKKSLTDELDRLLKNQAKLE